MYDIKEQCKLCTAFIGNQGGTKTTDGHWICYSCYTKIANHLCKGAFTLDEAITKWSYLKKKSEEAREFVNYLYKVSLSFGMKPRDFFNLLLSKANQKSLSLMKRYWEVTDPGGQVYILSKFCANIEDFFERPIDFEAVEEIVLDKATAGSYYFEMVDEYFVYH